MVVSHTVFPSPQVSQSIVEPYNALLASQYHIESTDMLICFDNEALYNISTRLLKTTCPTMNDRQFARSISAKSGTIDLFLVNHLVAMTMSGLTTCLRFPGEFSLASFIVIEVPRP